MITKGLGTNNLITKGFGVSSIIKYWQDKVTFILNVTKQLLFPLER